MDNTETSTNSAISDKIFRVFSSHPYLCCFAVCLLLTPLFFGSIWEMPSCTVPILLAVFIAGAAVFIWNKCQKSKLPVASAVLFIISAAAALTVAAWMFSRSDSQILWIFLIGCLTLSFLYSSFYKSRMKRQFDSAFIMGLGFLLKFCYVLGTSSAIRQHDIGEFNTNEVTGGHLGYMAYLYQNHHLYQEDYREIFQFCHPPLHHGICAAWVALWKDVLHVSQEKAVESLEMLTLFYSASIVLSAYYILRYFKLEGKALYIPLMIISFHPCFIYLSAFLNNDALMWALVTGAVLTTLRWYDSPSLKGIMKISLCIGLGMMAKLSAALVAPPVALVFLIVFIRNFRKSWRSLLGQFIAFGAVCVPLGMWFPVRGLIRWDVPLNHVQELPDDMDQSIKEIPFIQRITDFSPVQVKRVFENWVWRDGNNEKFGFNETNPLITILKNSVFSENIGELDFEGMDYMLRICTAFFWLGVILAAAAFIAMIVTMFTDRSMDRTQKLFIGTFYALLVGNLYLMSAEYPMVCTMNFRYLMPTVITGALFIGMCIKKHSSKIAEAMITVPTVGFSVFSALIYIVVSQNS